MTVVAVAMVRDEADVIGSTVRHMLDEVDAVVVADNLSVDATREVLEELRAEHRARLVVVDDDDPAYVQSRKMTALAHRAAEEFGATWIVPFDADEWWYTPHADRLADVLEPVPARWHLVPAELYDHVSTGLDPDEEDPVRRIGWRRRSPAPLPKVAVRYRPDLVIEQGNHGAHYEEFTPAPFDPVLVVRHYPYRSLEQFVRKVRNGSAAYRAAGDRQAPDHGAHWRQWGDLLDQHGPEALEEIFRRWYWRADPGKPVTIEGERQPALLYDPPPGVLR
jgi:glycosyltransferase involved in cell wall biosynthesis